MTTETPGRCGCAKGPPSRGAVPFSRGRGGPSAFARAWPLGALASALPVCRPAKPPVPGGDLAVNPPPLGVRITRTARGGRARGAGSCFRLSLRSRTSLHPRPLRFRVHSPGGAHAAWIGFFYNAAAGCIRTFPRRGSARSTIGVDAYAGAGPGAGLRIHPHPPVKEWLVDAAAAAVEPSTPVPGDGGSAVRVEPVAAACPDVRVRVHQASQPPCGSSPLPSPARTWVCVFIAVIPRWDRWRCPGPRAAWWCGWSSPCSRGAAGVQRGAVAGADACGGGHGSVLGFRVVPFGSIWLPLPARMWVCVVIVVFRVG